MSKPPSRKDVIRQGWETYREKVIPKDAGAMQLLECERAFFAGASWLFSAAINLIDDSDDMSESDEALFASIESELNAFPLFDRLRTEAPKGKTH